MQIRRHVAFLVALLAGLTLASSASAATITVTTTADDLTPNDGSVSLREAITAINTGTNLGDPDIIAQNPGTFGPHDTVNFNLPGSGQHRIAVGSSASAPNIPLPQIGKPVTIDGTSQLGSEVNTLANADNAVTLVLLDGSGAGLNASGLFLAAGSNASTIKGLDVFGFGAEDVEIQSSFNTIVGNDIGFDLGGAPALSPRGVLIQEASLNTIGGTTPATRNIISGNLIDGVEILGSVSVAAELNAVEGNFIGTGPTGVSALGNGTGVPAGAGGGVQLVDANNENTIGGTQAGARNVIVANGGAGVLLTGSQENQIQGNFLGIGADGVTPLPNAAGVWLTSINAGPPAQKNLIGGIVPGSGNLIARNSGAGVVVKGTTATENGILGNSIFANGGLGIDLGNDGVTPNSPGGPHTGPNNLQNFPLITSVSPGQSATTVQGTLSATPSTTFRLEFFSSSACDPSGFGQGQTFLGFTDVTTDGSGNASYSATLSAAVPVGASVAATSTDPANNTSEFSPCFPPLASTTPPPQTPTTQQPPSPQSPAQQPAQSASGSITITSANAGKDGSIALTGTTTVAGKMSASGTLSGKGSAAASKHGRRRHKTPAAVFGPVSSTLAAGSFTLKLKPNSTALAQLRAGKRLTIMVTLTLFLAAGGKPLSSAATVNDRLPRGHTIASPPRV
jgi:CSLREA domain-containing protein